MHISVKVSALLLVLLLIPLISVEAQNANYAVYGIDASLVSASQANLFTDKCIVYLNLEKDNNIYNFLRSII